MDERKRLDEPEGSARRRAAKAAQAEMGDMVEKEAKRLEVTRRRQERELTQLVHFEVARKEQQVRAPCLLWMWPSSPGQIWAAHLGTKGCGRLWSESGCCRCLISRGEVTLAQDTYVAPRCWVVAVPARPLLRLAAQDIPAPRLDSLAGRPCASTCRLPILHCISKST